jgi:hypothetical protein
MDTKNTVWLRKVRLLCAGHCRTIEAVAKLSMTMENKLADFG